MIIFALDILLARLAVTNMQMNVFVFRREFFEFGFVDVFAPVADAEEKPRLALRAARGNGVGHAQHRRDADAAGDEHDRIRLRHVEEEMAGRRLDVEDVAFLHAVVKKTGTRARRHVRFVRRRFFPFDRDAIIIFLMRTFGKRVAANERLVASGQIQLERQILSRLELLAADGRRAVSNKTRRRRRTRKFF